ncbi:MAG: hypothetical protein RL095_1487 [Verrucomicrobiota bacterium]|jgi:S1-C subfamily serine protease
MNTVALASLSAALILGAATLAAPVGPVAPAASPVSAPAVSKLPSGAPRHPQALDAEQIMQEFTAKLGEMLEKGRLTPIQELREQLQRPQCELKLPAVPAATLSQQELYKRACKSVVIVGNVAMMPCKDKSCSRLHPRINPATGYLISASGVMVTNYHVMADKGAHGVAVRDYEGKVFAVKEILAANADQDIAIVQLEGSGFTPLPLGEDEEVGSPVFIVGHPDCKPYILSSGMITSYPIMRKSRDSQKAQMMFVSSEFCGGSSGSPVLSDKGEVIGMVSSLIPVVKPSSDGSMMVQQLMLRTCPPVSSIRAMIKFK